MTRRILALTGGQAALTAGGLWITSRQAVAGADASILLVAGFALVLTVLAQLPRIHLEHARHACWVTPGDGAVLIGLFALGPFGFLAAAMSAEVLVALRLREPPLKASFNLASMAGGYTAAATTYAVLGRTDPLDPLAWLAGAAALAALSLWDILATSAIFSIIEDRPFGTTLRGVAPPLLISLVLSAALGLVALILVHESLLAVLLFVPILGILLVSTRGVSAQRAERVRFQRLYESSANLAELAALPETLAMVATEGRRLVTGATAICAASRPDGAWIGMLVDDTGTRPASAEAVGMLAELATGADDGELAEGQAPPEVRRALPPFVSIVWASRGSPAAAGQVILAVLRELPTDEQDEHRADVLAAFIAHAATVIANADLHTDVQQALERQVELNRQKSEFVAAVSHELRTPLASMIGSVQTVHRSGDGMPSEDRVEMLELGLSQGARLRTLIEDLLLVAAADHQAIRCQQEPVTVADVVDQLRRELPSAVAARVDVRIDPSVGTIASDRDKLHRIVLNLVQNAGKYAPEGAIVVAADRERDRIVLTVSDHGPGIAVADRERVFERFVQLDQSSTRRQGGTGLGLHLCRELAGLLGGQLSAAETPGGGARMVLVLPGRPAEVETGTPDGERPRLPAGATRSPLKRPAGLSRPASVAARPTSSPASVAARPASVAARPASVAARPASVAARPASTPATPSPEGPPP